MYRKSLFLAIIALMTEPAIGQSTPAEEERHHTEIEEITVRALPFDRSRLETARPVDMLVGESLDDSRGMTLGETLQQQPGVQSTAYGAGASRPVIRGLGGHRVLIVEDGLSTGDTSAQSDDHGVSVDPLLIDRIEILRGPGTLLYGSRAAAGVVNLVDGRIPKEPVTAPLEGRFELRGDSVADQRSSVLRLDGGSGNLAWHLDGTWREADDYEIPGPARINADHDEHDEHPEEPHTEETHDEAATHQTEHTGRLTNSFVESRAATAGASWVSERGHLGASIQEYRSEYGIPAPHAHFEGDGHESHEDEGVAHAPPEEEHAEEHGDAEEYAWIDMEKTTFDLSGEMSSPVQGLASAGIRFRHNDYLHREIELAGHEEDAAAGEHEHEGGTVFDIQSWHARLDVETEPYLGGWQGAFGLQLDQQDYVAAGAEAYIPPNETRSTGAFALQERRFEDLTVSVGARVERSRVTRGESGVHEDEHAHEEATEHEEEHGSASAPLLRERWFTTWSASLGAVQQLNERWQIALHGQHSQRAPGASELFAEGPHLATFTYEEGNPTLGEERTNALDLRVHRHGERLDLEANVFYNRISNFIYLADTGEEIGGFPVRRATQEDVTLQGIELEAVWQFFTQRNGHFDLRTTWDQVRGRLDRGGNLPRMSPSRAGIGLDWHHDNGWRAGLDVRHVMEQDDTAAFESRTPGHTLVGVDLARELRFGSSTVELFLQGRNLTDQEARVATSYLKEYAPLPGRNIVLGLRGTF